MTEEEIKDFVEKDFSKQLHLCCMKYCARNHVKVYNGKKMAKEYFQCRAYLWKLPRQTIKNIYLFLDSHMGSVNLYDLENIAASYVRDEQAKDEKKKVKELTDKKEYKLDLEGFLSN